MEDKHLEKYLLDLHISWKERLIRRLQNFFKRRK